MLDLVWTSQAPVFEALWLVQPTDWREAWFREYPELMPIEPVDPEIGWTTTLDGGW